ncbi:MAG: ATP-binding protein [Candidatus Hodarchaeota archaeon]
MWIVLGEEKGRLKLVSSSKMDGILPKGSFLTVESDKNKHILRVVDSQQHEPYSPAPMLVDMDLAPLHQDQKCQNIILATRVGDITERQDGLIDFIRPQLQARRSNQDEIDIVLGLESGGPQVFAATVQGGKNQALRDEKNAPIVVSIPPEFFYHQILICGKTGSGKTVASKYLAQYFVEELAGYGAVLAVNVKDVDFLKMEKATTTSHQKLIDEWKSIQKDAHGIDNFTVYYPANQIIDPGQELNMDVCKKITLDVRLIDPEALSGLIVGFSDIAAQHLPNIFRAWQRKKLESNSGDFTFANFVRYFALGSEDNYRYDTINSRGDSLEVTLPWATYHNILRNLNYAIEFFDDETAETISAQDILVRGKMSVINVAGEKGIQFGSVILRHLLKNIVEEKSTGRSKVPILIIIDEVHQFWDTSSSKEALGELDTICRTGRSKEIGVIFSSQNPSDIPRGLSNVINTKFFFKSDRSSAKDYGIYVTDEEVQNLGKGFAIANIHGLPQVRVVKFPLALSGVFEKGS